MKITIDKAVLEQALEALRYCRATVASVETERRQAIAGLQEALAQPQQDKYTYASTQATMCAGCGEHKHTPLRIDAMGGYVCLTCIDQKLESLLGEFGYIAQPQQEPVDALDNPRPVGEVTWGGCVSWNGSIPDYGTDLYTSPPACKPSNQPDSVAGYVSKIESLIKERDGLKERLSNSLESGGIKTVEIDRIKPKQYQSEFESFVKRELGDVAVKDQGRYISPKIQNYWLVWQAAHGIKDTP